MKLSDKDKKYQRYQFVDWNGSPVGVENTDNLDSAVQKAIDFQCEVIYTQVPSGNQIVYSAWDGWNLDYDFYNESESRRIMEGVNYE